MRIRIVYIVLSFFLFISCNSQNKKSDSINFNKGELNIKIDDNFKDATSLKFYKYNPNNNCNQSKAVSIVKDNKISECFDYVKTISGQDLTKLIKLLYDENTYGNEDIACFDTEYSLVLYKENIVVGYLNISLSCNKLISNPEITERESFNKKGLRKVGFSKLGKKELMLLLGI